jgi:hypothetical protein
MAEGRDRTAPCLHRVVAGASGWLRPSGARLGAAAAVLAASGVLLVGCATGSTTSTAGGTTQREAISQALVTAGGRHIVVPFTGGGCVQGGRLTAAETSSTVTLVLRQILSGSSVCPADLTVGTAVTVTLAHPLGGRSLVDGSTGRPIPYLDGRNLLRVTYLPPGYRFSAYLPFPSPVFTAWEREFVSPGQAAAPVDVEQVPGNATVPPSWPVISRVRVGSRLAAVGVLTGNGQVFGRAITWRAGGYTFVIYTVMVRAGQHLVSAAQLTSIAAGLRS